MYQIKTNGKTYKLSFIENKTAKDIKNMLPLKLSMQPYSDIEYYGILPRKPFFDKNVTTTQAEENTVLYCKEYNALVVVCKKHKDIFREVPVGTLSEKISWSGNIVEAEIEEV